MLIGSYDPAGSGKTPSAGADIKGLTSSSSRHGIPSLPCALRSRFHVLGFIKRRRPKSLFPLRSVSSFLQPLRLVIMGLAGVTDNCVVPKAFPLVGRPQRPAATVPPPPSRSPHSGQRRSSQTPTLRRYSPVGLNRNVPEGASEAAAAGSAVFSSALTSVNPSEASEGSVVSAVEKFYSPGILECRIQTKEP